MTEPSATAPAGGTAADGAKADGPPAEEPKDDLVSTHHVITINGAELRYTVTAGRVVIRQEGHTDDKFDGAEAKAEWPHGGLHPGMTLTPGPCLGDVRLQRRALVHPGSGCTSACWWPRRVLMGDARPACCRRRTGWLIIT